MKDDRLAETIWEVKKSEKEGRGEAYKLGTQKIQKYWQKRLRGKSKKKNK